MNHVNPVFLCVRDLLILLSYFSGLRKSTRKLCMKLWRRLRLVRKFYFFLFLGDFCVCVRIKNEHFLLDFCYIPAELMILGFISLILVFSQYYIAKICIPVKVADTMLPCPANSTTDDSETGDNRRRLLWYEHRILAAGAYSSSCKEVTFSLNDQTAYLTT